MNVNPINILLVEDSPDDIELILRAFRKSGMKNRVYVVKDGQEALNYAYHRGRHRDEEKAPPPGLILMDIYLPKVDGIEVLKQLKSDPKLRKIPVVMLTSSESDPDIEKSYQLGANSYIVKPVTPDKFTETIHQIEFYWVVVNSLPERGEPPHGKS